MVSTPKKIYKQLSRRLSKRPGSFVNSPRTKRNISGQASPTIGGRGSPRTVSADLVSEMQNKMKMAARYTDTTTAHKSIKVDITVAHIDVEQHHPISNYVVRIDVDGKAETLSQGMTKTFNSHSLKSIATLTVMTVPASGTSSDDVNMGTPKKMKRKIGTLRGSMGMGLFASNNEVASTEISIAELSNTGTDGSKDFTVYKHNRKGTRGVIPAGTLIVKGLISNSSAAMRAAGENLDIMNFLLDEDSANDMEMDKENTAADANANVAPVTNKEKVSTATDRREVIKQGYLNIERQAEKAGWKMCWLVLTSKGHMECFRSEHEANSGVEADLMFDLEGALSVLRAPMSELSLKNVIKVTFDDDEPFYTMAESREDCVEWIKALSDVLTPDCGLAV